jgi:hypothetical protein
MAGKDGGQWEGICRKIKRKLEKEKVPEIGGSIR